MRTPDRALRRQLALLQELEDDDRVAVLALLDETERNELQALLEGDNSHSDSDFASLPLIESLVLPDGLSSWLHVRLGQQGEGNESEAFSVTEHCRDALRSCIAELVPQPERRHTLFERIANMFKLRPASLGEMP